jgi:hypothetical protein
LKDGVAYISGDLPLSEIFREKLETWAENYEMESQTLSETAQTSKDDFANALYSMEQLLVCSILRFFLLFFLGSINLFFIGHDPFSRKTTKLSVH